MSEYRGSYRSEDRIYREAGYSRGIERKNIGLADHPTVSKLLGFGGVPTSGALLELGAGDGNGTVHLARWPFEIVGVEISPTAVEMAARRLDETGTTSATVIELDAVTLEGLDDASFDVVIDSGCLHCILDDDDRAGVFASVHRVLKAGGSFIGSTQAQPIVGRPTNCEVRGEIIFALREDADELPIRTIRDPKRLAWEFETGGFAIKQWEHYVFLPGHFCHHVHYHAKPVACTPR